MDKPDVRALAEDVPARGWICDAIDDVWGERCRDFDPDCATCRAWAEYDRLIATRETAKAEGRRQGLEEAAKVADDLAVSLSDGEGELYIAGRIAKSIRAIAQKAEG